MKRPLHLLFTLIIAIFAGHAYAQMASGVKIGEMVRQSTKEAWADLEPLGEDDQGVYYLALPYSAVMSGPMVADGDYHLFLVNKAGERVKSNVANFLIDGRKSEYEFTREMNGKVLVFTSVENKRARSVSFYVQELDRKNLQFTQPKEVVTLSFAELKRDYERASFKSEVSRDKSKMLISFSLVDDENTMLTFGYVLLDASLKEIYKWSGGLDMSEGVYLFDQFRVSNKGDVYLETRFFANEKAHDKNVKMRKTNILASTRSMEYRKNYEHRLVRFEKGNTTIVRIPNTDRFYDVLDMQVAPDGNLILVGFYSPLEEEIMPVGAVCLKVNVKTGAIKTSTKEFGTAFMMPSDISIKNNGLAAGKEQYLKYRFIVSDIQFNKDGGYTLIGERNVNQIKATRYSYYTVNHLDDLAIVDVSAAGVVTAVHKVEKSQQAESLQLFNASYYYTEYNNNRYLVFVNLGKGFKAHQPVLVTLSPDGKQTREILFDVEEVKVTIRPKDTHLHKGTLVMYGDKNTRYSRWLSKEL